MSEELKLDPENQYIGDLMILQVLADSEDVNDQEREVLLRWIENSQPPASRDAEVQRLRDTDIHDIWTSVVAAMPGAPLREKRIAFARAIQSAIGVEL